MTESTLAVVSPGDQQNELPNSGYMSGGVNKDGSDNGSNLGDKSQRSLHSANRLSPAQLMLLFFIEPQVHHDRPVHLC